MGGKVRETGAAELTLGHHKRAHRLASPELREI